MFYLLVAIRWLWLFVMALMYFLSGDGATYDMIVFSSDEEYNLKIKQEMEQQIDQQIDEQYQAKPVDDEHDEHNERQQVSKKVLLTT